MTVSTRPPTGAPFEGDANRRPNLRVIETPQLFPGCVVQCRSHRHLVEEVEPADEPGGDTIVRMACLDDDANGQKLEVFWEREVDARVLGKSTWETVGQRGFDDPQVFSSYLHTLQWNCVTSLVRSRYTTADFTAIGLSLINPWSLNGRST